MTGRLEGKRVLVVEDEYFIASDLKRQLTLEGAETVGPVGSLAGGLSLAEEPLDAAVLDVSLAETLSYPIADRDVPYLFLTDDDGWSISPSYREAPRLAKSFAPGLVVRTEMIAATPGLAQ